jgi:hypothetical protein
MGFRAAITGAFQTYALSMAYRRGQGHDMLGGGMKYLVTIAERAASRR